MRTTRGTHSLLPLGFLLPFALQSSILLESSDLYHTLQLLSLVPEVSQSQLTSVPDISAAGHQAWWGGGPGKAVRRWKNKSNLPPPFIYSVH